MRFPRTLSVYIGRETTGYAVLGLVGVGSILLTQNLLRQLERFSTAGLNGSDVLEIVGALVVMLSSYAVPVAFLFGVLVAMGRISSDSELTAMRALGISLAQLSVPFLALALLVSVMTAWLLAEVAPNAQTRLREIAVEIASRGALIEPGSFQRLDLKGERLLFVDNRDETDVLHGVLISDRSNGESPFTVVAETGRFRVEEDGARAHLLLEAGDIHFEPTQVDDRSHRRIAFATFDYSFDVGEDFGAGPCAVRPREMDTRRIREILAHFRSHGGKPPDCVRLKTAEPYEIEFHRRLALPVAPILFALLGISLGMQRSRGARSWGMLLCIALVFSYYALLSFGTFLAMEGTVPAPVGIWLPNLVFGATAVPLLSRARRAEL
jgi:lipopolysaccharide export system permease protein